MSPLSRPFGSICILAFLLYGLTAISRLAAVEVEIPDPTLESVLRVSLSKPTGALTDEDLVGLTVFQSDGSLLEESERISDLTGLEYAINLESLELTNHSISNLLPLMNLTSLGYLDLGYNKIEQISALWALENLESLNLRHNRIDNEAGSFSSLSALDQLLFLDVSYNQIVQVSTIWGLDDLYYLDVSYNFLDLDETMNSININRFKGFVPDLIYSEQRTKYIVLSTLDSEIDEGGTTGVIDVSSNITWTATCVADWIELDSDESSGFEDGSFSFTADPLPDDEDYRIATVLVGDTSIEIIQGTPEYISIPDAVLEVAIRDSIGKSEGQLTTKDLAQLISLSISTSETDPDEVKVSSLSGLEHATNLKSFTLTHSLVTDFSPIKELINLETIYIYDATVTNPDVFSGLTSLNSLSVYECNLTSVPSISPSVKSLYLSGNAIADLTPLAGEDQLSTLELARNQISDIGSLSGLVNLVYLRLDGNQIRDMDALRSLSNLRGLLIYSNHLTSIEPLMELPSLESVGLQYNYIDFSEGSDEAGRLQVLRDRGFVFYNTTQYSPVSSITIASKEFGPDGGFGEMLVFSNTYWSAESDVDWLTFIDGEDRFGNGVLSFKVASKLDLTESRYAIVVIENKSVEISQHLEVPIEDPALERAIRTSIGKPSGPLLTVNLEELANLHIDASDSSSDEIMPLSLDGLEIAKNLTVLQITDASLSSLRPLVELPSLHTLTIYNSTVDDSVSFLGLDSLEVVNIEHADLTEIPELPSSVHTLSLLYNRLTDIGPIERLVSLRNLRLRGNDIENLDPLLSLSELVELDLGDNEIRNIDVLESLEKLENLDLYGNHLKSVRAFLNFPALKRLNVVYNYIDFSQLSEAYRDLTELQLKGVLVEPYNQKQPIWSVTNSNVQIGEAGGKRKSIVSSDTYWSAVTDVDWIVIENGVNRKGNGVLEYQILADPDLKGVRTAIIQVENQAIEVAQHPTVKFSDPLVKHAVLQALGRQTGDVLEFEMSKVRSASIYLEGEASDTHQSVDLSSLGLAKNLISLSVYAPVIDNWEVISDMDHLESLQLSSPNLDPENLGLIENLTTLESLTLSNCNLKEIPRLPVSLKYLWLNYNSISDLTPLEGLLDLRELNISENRLRDLTPIAGLTNLQVLYLQRNEIESIDALRDLQRLERLDLYSNFIRSGDSLTNLSNLLDLSLTENHLTDLSGFENLENLLYLSVSNNYIDFYSETDNALVVESLVDAGVNVDVGYQTDASPWPNRASLDLGKWGGEYFVAVYSSTYWSAQSDQSWIHLSETSFFGNEELAFAVEENSSGQPRTAIIMIGDYAFTVEQAGAESRFELSLESVQADHRDQWFNLHVSSEKLWTASISEDRLTISDAEGAWEQDVQIYISKNPTNVERTAYLSIGPETLEIVQTEDAEYFKFLDTVGVDAALEENWLDGDSDRDGWSNVLEFTRGSDPFNHESKPFVHVTMNDGRDMVFVVRQVRSTVSLVCEYSSDFETWQSLEPTLVESLEGGLVRFTVEGPEGLESDAVFYRFQYLRDGESN